MCLWLSLWCAICGILWKRFGLSIFYLLKSNMCFTLCSHHCFSFNRNQSSTQHSSNRFPLLILQTTIMQFTTITRAEHTFPHTNTLFTTQRPELIRIFALSTIVRLNSNIENSVWRLKFRILEFYYVNLWTDWNIYQFRWISITFQTWIGKKHCSLIQAGVHCFLVPNCEFLPQNYIFAWELLWFIYITRLKTETT